MESSRLLIDSKNSQEFALGLYLYAVEEYGKAILLKKSITGNKTNYVIDGWILGIGKPKGWRNSHDPKLKEGFDNLPADYIVRSKGVVIDEASSKTRTIIIEKVKTTDSETIVSVMARTTGTFFNSSELIYNFDRELKDECFYMDWDSKNRSWKYRLAVDAQELKKNIECFKKIVANLDLQDKIFKPFALSVPP